MRGGSASPRVVPRGYYYGNQALPPRKEAPAVTSAPARAAVPAPKIESPTYYDYRADKLVPVNFASLGSQATLEQGDGGQAPVRPIDFSGLADFQLMAEKPIADALLGYYGTASAPLWIDDQGQPTARAQEAMRVMGEADQYGLDPKDYAVPEPLGASREGAIRFEMALSAKVLRYLRDASGGRIDPNRLSGYHDFAAKPFDGKAELARMGRAKKVEAALLAAHPQMPQYQTLRAELAKLRNEDATTPRIDPQFSLKPGETSPEFPAFMQLVGERLPAEDLENRALALEAGKSETYGRELVPVIKAAQEAQGLRGDGVIGPRTVQALAGWPVADREEKLKVAMEQLRWLPRSLGDTYVFINQPAYTAAYVENGTEKLNMRTVIGGVKNQTAFFVDELERVEYNPYWGVPQSIIVNEMLPRLRSDPGYLDRAGYEVTDSSGKRIPSASISWGSYGAKIPYNVRQTPSEENALGELKIMFPNKHAIYMHDTPAKALFKQDMRAASHGCVRLAQPREMAAAVLGTDVAHIEQKIAGGHSVEKVTRKIPIYVAYFTAWPAADGTVKYFGDVYERDKNLGEAISETQATRATSS
ncbi:MAG: L,D-transpeptidase family protein [Methylobacterium mesophilicum]|nr:L,D-transpeptidase family protein [Methylobacterium mesophilicum]